MHAEAQPAWAIYTFAVGNRLPADATVDLALAEGATVWLAAADYELGRWQIAGPFGAAAGLPLGPANRSPGNTVAVAVLALPGSPATVEQVNLHTQNQLPEAALSLSVAAGDLPLAVTLTATGSDPDGGVASIKWDFEGDGTFDLITTDFAPVTHVYGQGGTLHPTVKVTDDEGGSSTAQQTLAVHGWTVVNVAPGGYASSSALIAGHPALAFVYRQTPGDVLRLAYAYSKSATGSQGSDWSVTDVDAFNSYLLDADLAEIDNSPAIAYSEDETCGLHYAYASGTGVGALRWHALTLDNSGQVGRMPSLAEVAHAPAIAYGPRVDGALRYMRAGTANGSQPSTWTTVVVDAGSTRVGGNASLAVVDGAPAIAYNDTYAGTLKYAHASTADGLNPADWSMLTLAASGAPSDRLSLGSIGGRPALAWNDSVAGRLIFFSASTANGDQLTDWQSTVLDTALQPWLSCSLAEVGGTAAVAYDWGPAGSGRAGYQVLAPTGTAQPGAWVKADSITPDMPRYGNPSLLQLNGKPALSFSTDYGVSYAVMQ